MQARSADVLTEYGFILPYNVADAK